MGYKMVKVNFTPRENEQLDVTINVLKEPRSVIHGVVLDECNKPRKDAVVKLLKVNDCDPRKLDSITHTFTDEQGEFLFGPLCPGVEYVIKVWIAHINNRKIVGPDPCYDECIDEPEHGPRPRPEHECEPGHGPRPRPGHECEPGHGPRPRPGHECEPGHGPRPRPEHEREPGHGPRPRPKHECEPGPGPRPRPGHECEPGPGPRPRPEHECEPEPEHGHIHKLDQSDFNDDYY